MVVPLPRSDQCGTPGNGQEMAGDAVSRAGDVTGHCREPGGFSRQLDHVKEGQWKIPGCYALASGVHL